MLARDLFDFDEPMTGMEIELNLVDRDYLPKMNNADVLRAIADIARRPARPGRV